MIFSKKPLHTFSDHALMPLEILHVALVFFSGRPGLEGAEIPPLTRLWIDLPRIEPVLAG
jgi:hypothetical protein